MIYSTFDYGNHYIIILNNALILGYGRPMMSVTFDCKDFEHTEKGMILYGSEPLGLMRSYNELILSEKPSFLSMHDQRAEIKPLNGSRIIATESGSSYEFTCLNGEELLKISLNGSCRCEDSQITLRRGASSIDFSVPISTLIKPNRRGFEYEAEKCLSLITDGGIVTPDSELLPLLLLVDGLKTARFDNERAMKIKKLMPTMSENGKVVAEAVTKIYYRAFGI